MIDTPVTICFVYTLKPNNSTYQQLNNNDKSCDDFNVARATVRGQHCVFVNVTCRNFDQSRACILR